MAGAQKILSCLMTGCLHMKAKVVEPHVKYLELRTGSYGRVHFNRKLSAVSFLPPPDALLSRQETLPTSDVLDPDKSEEPTG